jgi:hypothetical protein
MMKFAACGIGLSLVGIAGCRGVELDSYTNLVTTVNSEAGVATVVASLGRADSCSGDASVLTASLNDVAAVVALEELYEGGLFPSLSTSCTITVTGSIPYQDDGLVSDLDLVVTSADDNDAAVEVTVPRAVRHTFITATSTAIDVAVGTALEYTIHPPFDDEVTAGAVYTVVVSDGVQQTGGAEVVVNSPTSFEVGIPTQELGSITFEVGVSLEYECTFGEFCTALYSHGEARPINLIAAD